MGATQYCIVILTLVSFLDVFWAHTVIDVQEFFNQVETAKVKDAHPDSGLDITKFLKKYNYPLESHSVTTEDEYILGLHRIPHGQNEENSIKEDPESPKPVVLLVHGLFSSSMDYVNMGPGKALALLLADQGYDVWLGNSRGNTWSRKHNSQDPDKNSTFWQFSYHEMGYYDLPAVVDYILEETGATDLSYVGHSQGTCQFWVFLSERPEYNAKINTMVALAPVAYFTNLLHPLLRLAKNYYDQVFELIREIGWEELLPYNKLVSLVMVRACLNEKLEPLCGILVELLGGFDTEQLDNDFAQVIVSNAPAGASVHLLKHFAQGITYGHYRKYDYGVIRNLEIYNSSTPPEYDLSQITANVVLFSAEKDWFALPEDVDLLQSKLKNVQRYVVNWGDFSHIDFIWAKDIYSLLNVFVVNSLNTVNGLPLLPTDDSSTSSSTEIVSSSTPEDSDSTTEDSDGTTEDSGSTTTEDSNSSTTTEDGGSTTEKGGNGSGTSSSNYVILIMSVLICVFSRLKIL